MVWRLPSVRDTFVAPDAPMHRQPGQLIGRMVLLSASIRETPAARTSEAS